MWQLLQAFFCVVIVFFLFSLPFSPTQTIARTKVAVNICITNWPTSRSSYRSMTSNNSMSIPTEEADSETSELGGYNKRWGMADADEQHSRSISAERGFPTPVGIISEVGSHVWRAVLEKKSYNVKSFHRMRISVSNGSTRGFVLQWNDTEKALRCSNNFRKPLKPKTILYFQIETNGEVLHRKTTLVDSHPCHNFFVLLWV